MLRHHLVAKAASATTSTINDSTHHLRSLLIRPIFVVRKNYGPLTKDICSRRSFHIPSLLLPPVVFTGLVLALYTWKSFVMVSLQNKIIYAPYLPPSARHEKISDYESRHYGIGWKELRMKSIDGTDLALAVATVSAEPEYTRSSGITHHVYILYLQGNASSLPPRLEDHSWILREIKHRFAGQHSKFGETHALGKVRFTQIGLSYRGYWTSRGRPSEIGINYDTAAAVKWISQLHDNTYGEKESVIHHTKPILIVWGQSIGAGFATNLSAAGVIPGHLEPAALILETPFLSIKEMLRELYPEKWLPYKYLHPFLRNFLDSHRNLETIATARKKKNLQLPHVLILQAGRDELVPERHTKELEERCNEVGIPVEVFVAPLAYHSDAIVRGRGAVAKFIMDQTVRATYESQNKRGAVSRPRL
ncbi:hypothetical protein N0V93_003251 [Gnomoniopsis smithogilvyi]|uniref:Alpha/beta hydrolase fold-3 domain-containing protein n=1 Tax=Gnomoniopsis smithogilvyi TaxID=1191159 RepID=A0A9W9CZY0_9PEZI|nr:hypothetical protein N0V93_003251 [Gnomoniopsis smithogilvyi]